jgi:hypothetical protein
MSILSVMQHDEQIESRAYEYLKMMRLIQDASCIRCGLLCMIKDLPNHQHFTLKYQCNRCRIQYNTFTATAFEGCRLRLSQIVFLIYSFISNHSVKMSHMLIKDFLPHSTSKNSVKKMYKKFRQILTHNERAELQDTVLEGPVEIDECMLYRNKRGYEARARPYRNTFWVFGLKCRTSGKFLIFPLRYRTRGLILQLILKHVRHGAWIYSDCWSAYINPVTRESYLAPWGMFTFT